MSFRNSLSKEDKKVEQNPSTNGAGIPQTETFSVSDNIWKHTFAVILFGPVGLFMNKMPVFQRAGMRKGGLPLPPAFQYLILMI